MTPISTPTVFATADGLWEMSEPILESRHQSRATGLANAVVDRRTSPLPRPFQAAAARQYKTNTPSTAPETTS